MMFILLCMLLLVVGGEGSNPSSWAVPLVICIILSILKIQYNRGLEAVRKPDQISVWGGNKMKIAWNYFIDILIAIGDVVHGLAMGICLPALVGPLAKAYRVLSG